MEFVGMKYGIGRHIYDLPARDGILATKLDWLSQAPIIIALTAGKISVAFLILRISVTKWHAYFLHTINVTLVFINIPLIVWTYHQCKPAALLWDPSIKGTCQDASMQGSFAKFQGCMSLLSHERDAADSQRQPSALSPTCSMHSSLSSSSGLCKYRGNENSI